MRKLLILGFFFVAQIGWAQKDSLSTTNKTDSLLLLIHQLPPLEELLEAAKKKSPLIKSRNALIKIKENEAKTIKNDWLNVLALKGSVGYGNSFIDVNQNNIGIGSNINTVLFNVGVILNFSPEYWANRKHKLKILEGHVEYEKAVQEETILTIAEKITNSYLELDYYKSIYIKASAGYESNRATLQIAKKKFIEGDIDIAIYNDIVLKNIKLDLEIEGYKQNLKKAYYSLQRILAND
ncbi:TolC family protein [Aureispira anguillae]|uniref:TolC family protein n=1 Tax=Aureispira anguillae TaxID=2864201 RepID=A0A915YM11_9BACT|nr:TolC family protein [Aureispira anguillae]BDS15593.1 TolC family protein [Aureispira anguillae]